MYFSKLSPYLYPPWFSYSPHGQAFRRHVTDKFHVHYEPLKKQPKSYLTECLMVANSIKQKAKNKEVLVFLSGGMDSEVVAFCLKEVKCRFKPVIIRFTNHLNRHDISYAFRFCDLNKLDPKIIQVDVLWEWKHKSSFFAKKYQTLSPQIVLWLIVCDYLKDGFFVFGDGDSFFSYSDKNKQWVWMVWEKFYALSKYFLIRKTPCCVQFFSATSEQIYAQLQDPLTVQFLNKPRDYFDFLKYKSHFYYKHFKTKPRKKYTGFENLQAQDHYYRTMFSKIPSSKSETLTFPINQFIKEIKTNKGIVL